MKKFWIAAFLAVFIAFVPLNAAALQIVGDGFSSIGGSLQNGSNITVLTRTEIPIHGPLSAAEWDELYILADNLLDEVSDFKDRIRFYDCVYSDNPACLDERLAELLMHPEYNFETIGFVDEFRNTGIENNLLTAINILDYLADNGYPQKDDVLSSLRLALRDLLTIYMVFADEFLIDALDFRFSSSLVNMDAISTNRSTSLAKQ